MKKIGILGTGEVGSKIGTKLVELGYTVKMGSRSSGNEKAIAWAKANGPKVPLRPSHNLYQRRYNRLSHTSSLQTRTMGFIFSFPSNFSNKNMYIC